VLRFSDVWRPGAVAAGAAIGIGAVVAGLSPVTTWIIFATFAVNWPLVILGVATGAALIAFGGHGTLELKAKLRDRFRTKLVPKIREAILENGIKLDGKHVPSIRNQLKEMIERGKEEAFRKLTSGVG
jgi:hypothetical protein